MFSAIHDVGDMWMDETPPPRRPTMSPPAAGPTPTRRAPSIEPLNMEGLWAEQELSEREAAAAAKIEAKLEAQRPKDEGGAVEAADGKSKVRAKAAANRAARADGPNSGKVQGKGKAKAKAKASAKQAARDEPDSGKAQGKAKVAATGKAKAKVEGGSGAQVIRRPRSTESATFAGRRRSMTNEALGVRFDAIKAQAKRLNLGYQDQIDFWRHMVKQINSGDTPDAAADVYVAKVAAAPEAVAKASPSQTAPKSKGTVAKDERRAFIAKARAAGQTLAAASKQWAASSAAQGRQLKKTAQQEKASIAKVIKAAASVQRAAAATAAKETKKEPKEEDEDDNDASVDPEDAEDADVDDEQDKMSAGSDKEDADAVPKMAAPMLPLAKAKSKAAKAAMAPALDGKTADARSKPKSAAASRVAGKSGVKAEPVTVKKFIHKEPKARAKAKAK